MLSVAVSLGGQKPAFAACTSGPTACAGDALGMSSTDTQAAATAANAILTATPADILTALGELTSAEASCILAAVEGGINPIEDGVCVVDGSLAASNPLVQAYEVIGWYATYVPDVAVVQAENYAIDVLNALLTAPQEVDCFLGNPLACPLTVIPATVSITFNNGTVMSSLTLYVDTSNPMVVNYSPSVSVASTSPGMTSADIHVHEDPDYCDPSTPIANGIDLDVLAQGTETPVVSYNTGSIEPQAAEACLNGL